MKKKHLILAAAAVIGQALHAVAQDIEKGVLVEHYTGAWCGICPAGWEVMKATVEDLDNIVVVSVHEGDEFQINEAVPVMLEYIGGFPSATADRFLFPTEGSVAIQYTNYSSVVPLRLDYEPKVAVHAASSFNASTRQLNIDVQALFIDTVWGDIRFNCYIVEDSVVGPAQANGENDNPNSTFFGMGDPIIGYPHPNVVRKMLGSSWGTAGIIADTAWPGDTFTHSYSYILPAAWNEEKVFLVPLVQMYHINPNKREILNIRPLGINENALPGDTIIDPGPNGVAGTMQDAPYKLVSQKDKLLIIAQNLSGNVAVRIFDMGGQMVQHAQLRAGAGTVEVPVSSLDAGVYLLSLEYGGKQHVQKFVKCE